MEKTFIYQFTNIVYRIEGSGIPVVLIHGFGEDSSIWENQIAFLKLHFQVIAIDLPGSGKSIIHFNQNTNTNSFTQLSSIEFYAQAIHSLLQHEEIETCYMLGHSMGGYITLCFAEKHPLMLQGFGLIHSTAYADNDEKKENRLRGIALMEEYGAYSFLKNTIPNLFSNVFKEQYPKVIEDLIEKANRFNTQTLQHYYHAMIARPNRTHVLSNSKHPVLFIIGTDDVAVPLQDSLQQTHLPQCSYINILKNVGHMGMLEAKEKTNQSLFQFLSRNVS